MHDRLARYSTDLKEMEKIHQIEGIIETRSPDWDFSIVVWTLQEYPLKPITKV